MTFTARYHGTCPRCCEHISPGDDAAWLDDDVVHAHCDDKVAAATRPFVVCPDCWMTKPCFCEGDS